MNSNVNIGQTMANTPCYSCINLNGSVNRYVCNSSKARLENDIVDGSYSDLPACPFFVQILSHEILTHNKLIVASKPPAPTRFNDILRAIQSYHGRTGKWPSQRQIWKNSNQASMTSVWNILDEMIQDGVLKKQTIKKGRIRHIYLIVDRVSSAV